MLTVEQLIEALQEIEDKTQPVEIAIRQYNKRYPIAYTEIFQRGAGGVAQGPHGTVRLYTSLPDKVYTVGADAV